MNLDDVFQTFLIETGEMLEDMERHLLDLEQGASDPDQLDALFRCVHTIKGSAGIFGLDHIVGFTHVVENILDQLREGVLTADRSLIALLLKCRDHIAHLVDLKPDALPEDVADSGRALLDELTAFTPLGQVETDVKTQPAESTVDQAERQTSKVSSDAWHISLRFGAETLRNGMDPASFIRYLGRLGTCQVTTLTDALPEATDLDPEVCYLGFEIDLDADTDKTTIEEVFEFVRDDCELHILPPRSSIQSFISLIQSLPEDDVRLGELLVASGALSRQELSAGLEQQRLTDAPVAPIGELLIDSGAVEPDVVNAALGKQQQIREARSSANQYIRVHADRLDALINLVGELVIASSAADVSAQSNGDTKTQEAVSTISSLVEEIRDSSLELRMVPIGETFQRFQRVVRDIANDLGKDTRLEIHGGDTELDKTVVEKIADPLMHLVRNAMDHGIESADVRRAAGKPTQGTVGLNAYHEAGSIVIEVSDDGGGLNRERILQKAIQRELIRPDQELADNEIFNLIFEPGFSTTETVTNLSGRGVGMDVVRRNIEALRGAVSVESTAGQGTRFRIRLPLTLAIIDGFLTCAGESSYVVPLESVVECVELTQEQRAETQKRNFVNMRGEVMPVIRLRDYFQLGGNAGRRENIVVVTYSGYKAGLIVDALQGEHQTVIKPLGKLFHHLKGISGSTILGSGEVALIIDVPSLVQRAVEHETHAAKGPSHQKLSKTPAAGTPLAEHLKLEYTDNV